MFRHRNAQQGQQGQEGSGSLVFKREIVSPLSSEGRSPPSLLKEELDGCKNTEERPAIPATGSSQPIDSSTESPDPGGKVDENASKKESSKQEVISSSRTATELPAKAKLNQWPRQQSAIKFYRHQGKVICELTYVHHSEEITESVIESVTGSVTGSIDSATKDIMEAANSNSVAESVIEDAANSVTESIASSATGDMTNSVTLRDKVNVRRSFCGCFFVQFTSNNEEICFYSERNPHLTDLAIQLKERFSYGHSYCLKSADAESLEHLLKKVPVLEADDSSEALTTDEEKKLEAEDLNPTGATFFIETRINLSTHCKTYTLQVSIDRELHEREIFLDEKSSDRADDYYVFKLPSGQFIALYTDETEELHDSLNIIARVGGTSSKIEYGVEHFVRRCIVNTKRSNQTFRRMLAEHPSDGQETSGDFDPRHDGPSSHLSSRRTSASTPIRIPSGSKSAVRRNSLGNLDSAASYQRWSGEEEDLLGLYKKDGDSNKSPPPTEKYLSKNNNKDPISRRLAWSSLSIAATGIILFSGDYIAAHNSSAYNHSAFHKGVSHNQAVIIFCLSFLFVSLLIFIALRKGSQTNNDFSTNLEKHLLVDESPSFESPHF